ncbi:MAG TPA: PAS domain-containing protein [Longilinea sp.]|nr:PAS domain-containing protein [Longilinea sp.]
MIGELTEPILKSLLETLPIEFSIIDANDKVMAWNKHESRIFKRPVAAVGRDVRNCHPQKSLAKVEQILAEMKAGKRDSARFWVDLEIVPGKPKEKVLIEYYALRDPTGKYLGCLETSQNIAEIQKLEGQQRLLDYN